MQFIAKIKPLIIMINKVVNKTGESHQYEHELRVTLQD